MFAAKTGRGSWPRGTGSRKRLAVGIHVDPHNQPQVSTLTGARCVFAGRQCAFPVVLFTDMGAGAVEAVGPAVEPADERLRARPRVLGAIGYVDEAAAAVHTDVVMRGERAFGPVRTTMTESSRMS